MSNKTVKVIDFYVAFPAKAHDSVQQELIEAALAATTGPDGRPQVATASFATEKEASQMAHSIRAHCQNRSLGLRVSCPDGATTVRVYRGENKRKAMVNGSAELAEAAGA